MFTMNDTLTRWLQITQCT